MNVSGPAVATAWRAFVKDAQNSSVPDARERARLVVLHDELELGLGKVKVRGPGGSMKGHNGLKSVQGSVAPPGGWWRIGVGIGRPESRERGDVSSFVLRKMMPLERETIEGAAEAVVGELVRLRDS